MTREEQLEELLRQKERALMMIAHELHSPLVTLLMWERVLHDETSDSEMRAQALAAIHESVMAQARLVTDLLDLSRARSGKLRIELRPHEIQQLLDDAVAAARMLADAKAIRIEHHTRIAGVVVPLDPGRIRQVLDNLLGNAIKFTPRGGCVLCAARSLDDRIEVAVADTGCGIAPDSLPMIFEPFAQQELDIDGGANGLGLGLAIARELVALHGGSLEAKSPGVGCGSIFTLVLPRTDGHRSQGD
jgi:signal transduction histidine kinase